MLYRHQHRLPSGGLESFTDAIPVQAGDSRQCCRVNPWREYCSPAEHLAAASLETREAFLHQLAEPLATVAGSLSASQFDGEQRVTPARSAQAGTIRIGGPRLDDLTYGCFGERT